MDTRTSYASQEDGALQLETAELFKFVQDYIDKLLKSLF